jgi:hypothetical protein
MCSCREYPSNQPMWPFSPGLSRATAVSSPGEQRRQVLVLLAREIVARQADCLNVARVLDRFPPLGKASRQFELWRRAVELWVAHGGTSSALPELAAELRALHHSIEPVSCQVDITAADLAPFLSGFASAEAHFGASAEGSPALVINLRADDAPLLRLFQRVFEVGHMRDIAPAGRSQQALSWRVGRLTDLRRLVEWFDVYPPRGRTAYIYAAWRELVMLEARTSVVRRAFAVEIRRRRRFIPGLDASSGCHGRSAGAVGTRTSCCGGRSAATIRGARWTTSDGAARRGAAPRHGTRSPLPMAHGSRRWTRSDSTPAALTRGSRSKPSATGMRRHTPLPGAVPRRDPRSRPTLHRRAGSRAARHGVPSVARVQSARVAMPDDDLPDVSGRIRGGRRCSNRVRRGLEPGRLATRACERQMRDSAR